MRSYSQAKKLSGSSSSAISNKMQRSQEEKAIKQFPIMDPANMVLADRIIEKNSLLFTFPGSLATADFTDFSQSIGSYSYPFNTT
ncbi:hypothetical protein GBA52_013944 [Prunus armeniaca]|nr:hypothetical protein GBA52_013944 [Prunus armeniaca]